jgi:transposase
MSGVVLHMKIIEDVRRLAALNLTDRAIARALKIDRRSVKKYRDLPDFDAGSKPEKQTPAWHDQLDWSEVIAEIRRGVPVNVVWEELRESGKIDIQYPGFWKQLSKRMPDDASSCVRVFTPGERVEIDYCDGINIVDRFTGQIIKTQLFVGVLCHSRYAFAEFTLTQSSADFLSSHVRMFEHFGGTPQIVTPDNLKSAVTKAHRYSPIVNPAYTRLAAHYDIAVVPARVARPKDKAIVERTIQIFQRWFYFRVRGLTFNSLVELNRVLAEHLAIFHLKKHRIFRRSRNDMFESEKTHLRPLTASPYIVSTHKIATPHPDCHIAFDKNYYSVPHEHRGFEVDVWASENSVEIYRDNVRVAFHPRSKHHGKFITNKDHYPDDKKTYIESTPTYLRSKASRMGSEISGLINEILAEPHPLKHLRRAQGILRLEQKYDRPRLGRAIAQAKLHSASISCQTLEKLLKNESFWTHNDERDRPVRRNDNENLRGADLYLN